jgi:hypothetical protein
MVHSHVAGSATASSRPGASFLQGLCFNLTEAAACCTHVAVSAAGGDLPYCATTVLGIFAAALRCHVLPSVAAASGLQVFVDEFTCIGCRNVSIPVMVYRHKPTTVGTVRHQ